MGRRTVLMLVAILVAALGSTLVFLYVQGINDRAIAEPGPRRGPDRDGHHQPPASRSTTPRPPASSS